ncbi:hypothetical protein Mal15_36510 [Stieleria maiorica]|uniref:Uncharacterized protein n=1 Tax=Stieleria maiorica TaxID=2795974 RepID=A0A5B9MJ01_9BACT|nr:hypothetical protein [Stieleria maiorica]QEF99585.1 hypothetical protein Mal15_36510 [Stieleria maiorica]
MRRISLGILILGGGILFSLPFRKSKLPDPSTVQEGLKGTRPTSFDDASIEMLVREVTEEVHVPVVYDPQTDYCPPAQPQQTRQLPLTYQDLAVPVDRDPFYESHFNATADVAAGNHDADESQRLAELERLFAETKYVDQSIAAAHHHAGQPDQSPPPVIAPDGKQWTFQNAIGEPPSLATRSSNPAGPPSIVGAQLASSDSIGKPVGESQSREASVLSPLPPPDDRADGIDVDRPRHWIQQPD